MKNYKNNLTIKQNIPKFNEINSLFKSPIKNSLDEKSLNE